MVDINIDCVGETCPVPLIEVRKALRKASPGDVVVIKGNHTSSKVEIPMAVEALGMELLDVSQEGDVWTIRIRK